MQQGIHCVTLYRNGSGSPSWANLFNRFPTEVRHVTQYRKDGKASKNTCGYKAIKMGLMYKTLRVSINVSINNHCILTHSHIFVALV